MKISELITLRNFIQNEFDVSIITKGIEKNYQRLIDSLELADQDIQNQILMVAEKHNLLHQNVHSSINDVDNLIHNIQNTIDKQSKRLFGDNYDFEPVCREIERIREFRKIPSDEPFETNLIQRISTKSDWKYPALEIGCRDGEWTRHLIASDPLYIADVFPEFLQSALEQFPEIYRARVKKYLIKDYKIENLPINQFGLIFSYNYFNYVSFHNMKEFLQQAMLWLRPGGSFVFTYNNADMPISASLAEGFFMSYIPKHMLIAEAERIGFEHTFSCDYLPSYSAIEFKKPGELKSVKFGQPAAEVKVKNNF